MEKDYLTLKRASASRQLVHQLWPLLFYQFAHRIGNGFDALDRPFGTGFLRGFYHQILGPRRHLAKLANGLCRHSDIWVHLDPHLIWQATKSYLERGYAFALMPGHRVLADCPAAELPTMTPVGRHETSRHFARNGERAIGNPVALCYHADSRASRIVISSIS
jgi:hypothetical protein